MQNKWFNNIKGNYINIQNKNIQLICKSLISWYFLKFYSKKYFQKNILNEILFCFIQDKKQNSNLYKTINIVITISHFLVEKPEFLGKNCRVVVKKNIKTLNRSQ